MSEELDSNLAAVIGAARQDIQRATTTLEALHSDIVHIRKSLSAIAWIAIVWAVISVWRWF